MDLSAVVRPEDVLLGLAATSKTDLLKALADYAALRLETGSDEIRAALLARESLGSTGIGDGIAIPHAALPVLKRPFGVIAVLKRPIDFGAVDDARVDLIFLLLTPPQRLPSHLAILSCFARKARTPEFCQTLRKASDPGEMLACLIADSPPAKQD